MNQDISLNTNFYHVKIKDAESKPKATQDLLNILRYINKKTDGKFYFFVTDSDVEVTKL